MDSATAVHNVHSIQDAVQVLAILQLTAHLWPKNAYLEEYYDFIVVGAGSAGCVVASRLSEIPDINVLLIEAGGDPPFLSVLPGGLAYLKNSQVDYNYTSTDDGYTFQHHIDKRADMTIGKMLGGTGSLNYMAYVRGNPHEYHKWAKAVNDSSWEWDNILPYFLKSENYTDPVLLNSKDSNFHGKNGEIKVKKYNNEFLKNYFDAFAEMGNDIVPDVNGNKHLGFTEMMFTIGDRVRQSTAYAFLSKYQNRNNLHVLKNAQVVKIIIEDKRAVGIEVLLANNKIVIVKARKEVIISGGALNTPKLLMLSGIGPKEHLKSKDIKVIADLPVGKNLQDHVSVVINYSMEKLTKPPESLNYHEFPFPSTIGFVSVDGNNYPDYQILTLSIEDPNTVLAYSAFNYGLSYSICNAIYKQAQGYRTLFVTINLLNAKSRGEVLLQSKDPHDDPIVKLGDHSNVQDLDDHVRYMDHFLPIVNTTYFKNVGAKMLDPQLEHCGKFKKYSKEYLRCYILSMMVTMYHYAGSSAMGSVVDSRLNVFGIKGLRVVDASVMPFVPSANTNAATVMVAEKAADMIKEDHDLC